MNRLILFWTVSIFISFSSLVNLSGQNMVYHNVDSLYQILDNLIINEADVELVLDQVNLLLKIDTCSEMNVPPPHRRNKYFLYAKRLYKAFNIGNRGSACSETDVPPPHRLCKNDFLVY